MAPGLKNSALAGREDASPQLPVTRATPISKCTPGTFGEGQALSLDPTLYDLGFPERGELPGIRDRRAQAKDKAWPSLNFPGVDLLMGVAQIAAS